MPGSAFPIVVADPLNFRMRALSTRASLPRGSTRDGFTSQRAPRASAPRTSWSRPGSRQPKRPRPPGTASRPERRRSRRGPCRRRGRRPPLRKKISRPSFDPMGSVPPSFERGIASAEPTFCTYQVVGFRASVSGSGAGRRGDGTKGADPTEKKQGKKEPS